MTCWALFDPRKIVPPNLVERQPDCPWDCMGHFIPCIRIERQRLIEKCIRTVIAKHPANRIDAQHIADAPEENLAMLKRMEDHHLPFPVFIVAIHHEWRMMMLSGTTPDAALLEKLRFKRAPSGPKFDTSAALATRHRHATTPNTSAAPSAQAASMCGTSSRPGPNRHCLSIAITLRYLCHSRKP